MKRASRSLLRQVILSFFGSRGFGSFGRFFQHCGVFLSTLVIFRIFWGPRAQRESPQNYIFFDKTKNTILQKCSPNPQSQKKLKNISPKPPHALTVNSRRAPKCRTRDQKPSTCVEKCAKCPASFISPKKKHAKSHPNPPITWQYLPLPIEINLFMSTVLNVARYNELKKINRKEARKRQYWRRRSVTTRA